MILVSQAPSFPLGLQHFSEAEQIAAWNQKKEERRKTFSEGMKLRAQTPVLLSDGIFGKAEETDQISFVNLRAIDQFQPDTIYILNNNDIERAGVKKYADMFIKQPSAHVCIWDFDNHHRFNTSLNLAVLSDFYVPCHPHRNEGYQEVTDAMGTPVSAGVIQWSRAYLAEHRERLLAVSRNPSPLGQHIFYTKFPARNKMIKTLGLHFKHVTLTTAGYHRRSELDRLDEWASHMSHWIVPTYDDLPIRVFDALITGGLPILPSTLKDLPALSALQEHLFYYEPEDIEAPQAIADAAADQFEAQGEAGLITRHELALANCHVDSRVQEILAQVYRHLNPMT